MTAPIKIIIHTRLEVEEPTKEATVNPVSAAGAKMMNILQILEQFSKVTPTTALPLPTYQGSDCVCSPTDIPTVLPGCCESSGVSTTPEPQPEAPLPGQDWTAAQKAMQEETKLRAEIDARTQEDLTPEEAADRKVVTGGAAYVDNTGDSTGRALQGDALQKAMQQAVCGRTPTVTPRDPFMPLPASDLSGAATRLWGNTHIPDKPRTWGEFLWGSATPSLIVGRSTLGAASIEQGNTEYRVLLAVYGQVCDSMPAKTLQVLYKKGGTHGCNLFCHTLARYILGYERTRLQHWLGLNKPNQREVHRRIAEATKAN